MISTIKYYFTILRAFVPSVYICFKYLPIKQAIKMPIFIYKPHNCRFKGRISIDAEKVTTGMIRIGFLTSAVYPNTGVSMNIDGQLVFKGKCYIGNDSYIVVGEQGHLVLGDHFKATCGLKLICMHDIELGRQTLLGWEVVVIDSNFHPLYDREKKEFKKAYDKIRISDNNWFAMHCIIMPGVTTPEHCVFGARSTLTKGSVYESYCVHGGNPIHVLSRNVERIIGQDTITEYK